MAHKEQPVLSAELQLYRLLPLIGDSTLYCGETLCPAFYAAGGGVLYAALPRRDLPGEYAD